MQTPQEFITALDSLRGQKFRPELHVVQIPPPTHIAPWTVALQAEVNTSSDLDPEFYLGEAKFVVLHDPQGQPAWNGNFRVVVHAKAPMDSELAGDPLLGEVAWSWLAESLDHQGASFHTLGGTVTRVFNETFGGLTLGTSKVELELRASWTPHTEYLTEHLLGWADFAAKLAGLGPWEENVSSLRRKVETI
ncbi:hypothetical protein J2S49_000222 [Arcanobacterium wilhelmae]|uniref:DUF3000 domain-containing protein n=1 Tax=Arcanobacterium wilhelmae TaxID=1803177 RepID=A0ABT9N9R5_9ACTO|nr:DUF3000 domain-containing protein [Arcanobacterium wilhelmae]MDP9800146.1 hypothetical protein [Arcanobacterium wilhelmae]WFN89586.1 DUF3000 domain-containing protein [Arcanobacterium wilhelmae]